MQWDWCWVAVDLELGCCGYWFGLQWVFVSELGCEGVENFCGEVLLLCGDVSCCGEVELLLCCCSFVFCCSVVVCVLQLLWGSELLKEEWSAAVWMNVGLKRFMNCCCEGRGCCCVAVDLVCCSLPKWEEVQRIERWQEVAGRQAVE